MVPCWVPSTAWSNSTAALVPRVRLSGIVVALPARVPPVTLAAATLPLPVSVRVSPDFSRVPPPFSSMLPAALWISRRVAPASTVTIPGMLPVTATVAGSSALPMSVPASTVVPPV